MNNRQRMAGAAGILCICISAGCLVFESSPELEVSLSADKDTYSFGEAMLLQVIVNTSQSMDNVTVRGKGLVSSKGPQIWLGPITEHFIAGTNIINFSERVPRCTDCTKLGPGVYNITASVFQNGEIIATVSCTIRLTR